MRDETPREGFQKALMSVHTTHDLVLASIGRERLSPDHSGFILKLKPSEKLAFYREAAAYLVAIAHMMPIPLDVLIQTITTLHGDAADYADRHMSALTKTP